MVNFGILRRAAMMAAVATAATLAIALPAIPLLGGTIDLSAWVLCAFCPLVVAFPGAAYILAQSDKLARAHRELVTAHAALAEAHARLTEKARHDDMTGMLNRQSFIEALETMRRKSEAGALLILDADHFKKVNDGYGHHAGDQALGAICGALARAVRAGDLVGRIGGEEFAVFLGGASEAEAAEVAERIRSEVERVIFNPGIGRNLRLTVSIGGASCRPGMTLSDLMREADLRLYEAKRRGRNRVIMHPGLPEAA
jgi:diguanylate cyclase (GGDEF)-like protein